MTSRPRSAASSEARDGIGPAARTSAIVGGFNGCARSWSFWRDNAERIVVGGDGERDTDVAYPVDDGAGELLFEVEIDACGDMVSSAYATFSDACRLTGDESRLGRDGEGDRECNESRLFEGEDIVGEPLVALLGGKLGV